MQSELLFQFLLICLTIEIKSLGFLGGSSSLPKVEASFRSLNTVSEMLKVLFNPSAYYSSHLSRC